MITHRATRHAVDALVVLAAFWAATCDGSTDTTTAPAGLGGSSGSGGGAAGTGGNATGGHGGGSGAMAGAGGASCTSSDQCDGHCGNGLQDCEESGTDCGGECSVCAQTLIFTDELTSADCAAPCWRDLVVGGEWTGGGWIPRADGDRIVFDFGGPVSCGYAKIVVDNFSPWTQVFPNDLPGEYALFAGIHDVPEIDKCQSLSQMNLLYPPAPDYPNPEDHNHLKFLGSLVGPTDPNDCTKGCEWINADLPGTWPFDTPSTYTFEFRWSLHHYTLWVNTVSEFDQDLQTYPGFCPGPAGPCWPTEKLPELRYLYIGQSPSGTAGLFAGGNGPLFTHVEAYATVCSEIWW